MTTRRFVPTSPPPGALTTLLLIAAVACLAGSERSHTFHGRDVFAYLGARLAVQAPVRTV